MSQDSIPPRSLLLPLPSPLHSSFWPPFDDEPQFNELVPSAVYSNLQQLTYDNRSIYTEKAWICAGSHDGDRHVDTDSRVSQDSMPPRSLLLPPPLHSSSPPYAGTLPFGKFVLSDVCSKLTKLTGHAVRSTYTNKVCYASVITMEPSIRALDAASSGISRAHRPPHPHPTHVTLMHTPLPPQPG